MIKGWLKGGLRYDIKSSSVSGYSPALKKQNVSNGTRGISAVEDWRPTLFCMIYLTVLFSGTTPVAYES